VGKFPYGGQRDKLCAYQLLRKAAARGSEISSTGLKISPLQLFKHQTIAELAAVAG